MLHREWLNANVVAAISAPDRIPIAYWLWSLSPSEFLELVALDSAYYDRWGTSDDEISGYSATMAVGRDWVEEHGGNPDWFSRIYLRGYLEWEKARTANEKET